MVVAIIVILFLAFLGYWFVKSLKAHKNSAVEFDDHHFAQAGVNVEFQSGTIRIKEHSYKVGQITGIKAEPYKSSHQHGASQAWKAIIEVDDFQKPRHEMNFLSRKLANEFTQRLSTAIRKAGGPSFT